MQLIVFKKYATNFWIVWLLIISFQSAALAQKKPFENLKEALFSSSKLSGSSGPQSVNWIDEGERFSFMQANPEKERDEIKSYDPATGKSILIFDGAGLTFPDSKEAFAYKSFEWSKDSRYLLFQTNFRPVWRNSGISDYYFYSIESKTLNLVAKDARTAELSPDGNKIGYERGGNLFVFNFATKKETQLTDDAKDNFYNGRFGWVYEEEFGLVQAWMWSPDSRYIAFWQTDERKVPVYQTTDYAGQAPEYVKIPYPMAGQPNPQVKIGVIDIGKNARQWMDLVLGDGYVPRLYWTSIAGQLAITHLNRAQNHLRLFFNDATTGKGKLIMEEKSDTWIDLFDFFAGIDHYFFFPENTQEFFWISDRDGWNHIYRYNYEGDVLNQVTQGNWEVVYVYQVDSKDKTIYYSSTEESPLERHLYSIRFDGRKKTKLTQEPGKHQIDFSPNSAYYIDRYSNVSTPAQVELWSTKGKMLEKMEDNAEVKAYTDQHLYAPKELFSFTTSDGQKLDGYLIKPIDFDENKKYPVVLNIYGGPGSQSVYNDYATNGWEQYLAQEGYVIASMNNRGSGGYGGKFKKMVYAQLGKWESKDFVETVKYLGSLGWADTDNMAIRGHSYGGFMSSYTMLNYPGVFKVALVGAPVTDWRLYDSIYTERYMGLLPQNNENYIQSSSTSYADQLEGYMFIAHSTMDDNVHVQNTFQLVKALIDNGKDADLRIYPPGAHGVSYSPESYVLLYSQYVDYLNEHLKNID